MLIRIFVIRIQPSRRFRTVGRKTRDRGRYFGGALERTRIPTKELMNSK
jgi:hypothetical protein